MQPHTLQSTDLRQPLPKVLVLSFSGMGSQNATGQLVADLFATWPKGRLLQVYWGLHPTADIDCINAAQKSVDEIFAAVQEFGPEVVYARPADSNLEYADLTTQLCRRVNVPVLSHIMDDWPARKHEKENGDELVAALESLLQRSSLNLTICREMSDAYATRYGLTFQHMANGVDPDIWESLPHRRPANGDFVVRYCGALADDMQQRSILEIGEAVAQLIDQGQPIRFEIYTMPWFQDIARQLCQRSTQITVHDLVPLEDYPQLLADAHLLILAYNFDPRSQTYTRYSFANKTPECLASGTPVLAYGPTNIPSIRHIKENQLGWVVEEQNINDLKSTLGQIISQPDNAQTRATQARKFTLQHNNIHAVRARLERMISELAEGSMLNLKTFTREDDVSVDETAVVFEYFRRKNPTAQGTMIDVGAHHGTAFKAYLDKGWMIHAFEPDPNNYQYVDERFSDNPKVKLNKFAVSNVSGQELSFYAASQSTGISSLIPFHEGHEEVARVKTIRLDEYLKQTDIAEIDFLKIDTEGNDLRVLQGFDWDRFRPEVIECEFEDAKTVNIGYDLHEQAKFLTDRGYSVYVSEWHPIIRYGIRHQWRRVKPYPVSDITGESWGNFLAFRDPVDTETVESLFLSVLAEKNPDKTLLEETQAPATPTTSTAPTPKPATPTPESAHQQEGQSGMITTHIRVLLNFLRSRSGLLTSAMIALALGAIVILPDLVSQQSLNPIQIAIAAFGWLAMTHVFAHTGERARIESRRLEYLLETQLQARDQAISRLTQTQNHEKLERSLNALKTELNGLKQATTEDNSPQIAAARASIRDLEAAVTSLQEQQIDIRRKLPELVRMINNIQLEVS